MLHPALGKESHFIPPPHFLFALTSTIPGLAISYFSQCHFFSDKKTKKEEKNITHLFKPHFLGGHIPTTPVLIPSLPGSAGIVPRTHRGRATSHAGLPAGVGGGAIVAGPACGRQRQSSTPDVNTC